MFGGFVQILAADGFVNSDFYICLGQRALSLGLSYFVFFKQYKTGAI